jgi:hypothetical protein
VRRTLQEWGWTGLTILGALIGLFMGLAIAPELPGWVPWALGIAVVAIFAVSWFLKRRRSGEAH